MKIEDQYFDEFYKLQGGDERSDLFLGFRKREAYNWFKLGIEWERTQREERKLRIAKKNFSEPWHIQGKGLK